MVQLGWGCLWPEQDPGGTRRERMGRSLQVWGQPSYWAGDITPPGASSWAMGQAFGMVQWGVRGLGEGKGLQVGRLGRFGGLCWKLCPQQEPCISPRSAL